MQFIKLPIKRKSQSPTVRSIGAEIFGKQASDVMTRTRDVLEAIARGDITADQEGPSDQVSFVQRQQESLMQSVNDDLLLTQIVERLEKAAVLQGLYEHNPGLVTRLLHELRGGNRIPPVVEEAETKDSAIEEASQ